MLSRKCLRVLRDLGSVVDRISPALGIDRVGRAGNWRIHGRLIDTSILAR